MPAVQEDAVWAALRTVQEPELHQDLVSLNMIRDLQITEEGKVSLTVILTTPACPLKSLIESEVKAAVIKVPGVTGVQVQMGSNVTSSSRGNAPAAMTSGIRNIIGVASGKGGVGKSTVAVNLAVALAKSGARVGLLDADIYGPNVPLMTGLHGQQPEVIVADAPDGSRVELIEPVRNYGLKIMSMGFLLHDDQPVVWRGPMLNSALRQFLSQVKWGELDYLIIDLPPGTGDVQISLIQLARVTGIVHVTTPQDVALQDVRRGVAMFAAQKIPTLGIIENMSYFECPHCRQRTDVFSTGGGERTAAQLGIRFLGAIPLDTDVRAAGDSGMPIVVARPDSPQARRFMEAAEQLAAQISVHNYQQGAMQPAGA